MPPAEKRRSLLWIPRSNRAFWDLLATVHSPQDGPLVAPALSGMAVIDGLYEPGPDEAWMGYGYQHYPRPAGARPEEPSRAEVCRRAAAMGYRQVIVLAPGIDRDGSQLERLDCR
jgi:hypothetical protein